MLMQNAQCDALRYEMEIVDDAMWKRQRENHSENVLLSLFCFPHFGMVPNGKASLFISLDAKYGIE